MPDIAIVGGGAAGMYAACAAADSGAAVTVFERNNACGIKLNLTGKGRCNVTNNCDSAQLIAAVPRNGRFLHSAFAACAPQDTMAFFQAAGVPLKTERGNRVFPQSDNAKDITGALKTAMNRRGVKIVQSRIKAVSQEAGRATGVILQDGSFVPFGRVILATGGLSYPKTGSSGDGLAMARALGHSVADTRPSLVPLTCAGNECGHMEGLSLKNVSVKTVCQGKTLYSDFGEMLFTANGVSGPLILSASAHLDKSRFPCELFIDFKPALDIETLDKRILKDFTEAQNKDFSNALAKLLPSKAIPVIIGRSGIEPGRKVNAITREERRRLAQLLKAFELEVTGLGPYAEAVVTSGGVSVKEIAPKTMESKLVKGLYFAGEIIDVDAYTGGFNLQIAWSTGYLAGTSAAAGDF